MNRENTVSAHNMSKDRVDALVDSLLDEAGATSLWVEDLMAGPPALEPPRSQRPDISRVRVGDSFEIPAFTQDPDGVRPLGGGVLRMVAGNGALQSPPHWVSDDWRYR